jgi:hypothetical protein
MSVDTIDPAFETMKIDEKAGSLPTAGDAIADSTPAPVESESEPKTQKLPFAQPAAASTISPSRELTASELAKYDLVLEHLKSITTLPTSSAKKNNETAPLSELEQYFLSKECILRYLRATKWNVNEAKKRLEGTIIWRREYGTDTLTAELVEPEVLPERHG